MKHLVMMRPKQPLVTAHPLRPREVDEASAAAFQLWLQRSLHQLFDQVAKEPIPEELLRLIEEDRRK